MAFFKIPDLSLESLIQLDPNPIGQGCFGTVYKASVGPSLLGLRFAVKVIQKALSEKDIADVAILSTLTHPNIVRTVACCYISRRNGVSLTATPTNEFGILMELSTTDLFCELKKHTRGKEPNHTWNKKIICGICDGLTYLHGKKIIHFDIKPQNVLLNGTDAVKLADFGLGGQGVFTGGNKYFREPTMYMPPEVRKGDKYGTNVDIYSLGVVMLQLYSEYDSFFDWTETLDRQKIEYDTQINIEKLYMPHNLILLVVRMTKDPSNRPTAAEVHQVVASS